MVEHFDISRIIGIEVFDKRRTSYRWLPEKQKTAFFGLIKRNSWHSAGFYSNGCYEECYESGCWDAHPETADSLIGQGYLVDHDETVWHKPFATVFLEADCKVTKKFNTLDEVNEWVEFLKTKSGKTFEIVKIS